MAVKIQVIVVLRNRLYLHLTLTKGSILIGLTKSELSSIVGKYLLFIIFFILFYGFI